jgi:hypothetical protein
MSKSKQSYPWLNNKVNSAKTIVERAKRDVPGFAEHYAKFEEQTTIEDMLRVRSLIIHVLWQRSVFILASLCLIWTPMR